MLVRALCHGSGLSNQQGEPEPLGYGRQHRLGKKEEKEAK